MLSKLAVLIGIASAQFWGQTAPQFEVASIKRNSGISPNTNIDISGGRVTFINASVKTLIRNAYDILAFQLEGEQHWLDSEMFDIVATTGKSEKVSTEQFRLLVKSLLEERFHLKTHWETRQASVYKLTVGKEGPRFKENLEAQEPGINTQKGPGHGRMKATHEPIAILASNLANQLGRFVWDQTGLQATYDWLLEWNPDPTVDSVLPSLSSAVQEQLGLRLEAQKGPMPTLVVDTVDRPSEN